MKKKTKKTEIITIKKRKIDTVDVIESIQNKRRYVTTTAIINVSSKSK